jgi:hypothetical protein
VSRVLDLLVLSAFLDLVDLHLCALISHLEQLVCVKLFLSVITMHTAAARHVWCTLYKYSGFKLFQEFSV